MNNLNYPTIFISSTCYDLAEVRNSLKIFIEKELHFVALVSDDNSFPITPIISPIDNCKEIINNLADIYVLIIDKRYGFIDKTGKSITHLEYLTAKAKGLPMYIFIKEDTDTYYNSWKSDGFISASWGIENENLFNFIKEVFTEGDKWIFKYKVGTDIHKVLQEQITLLTKKCLQLNNKATDSKLSSKIMTLSGESLKIAIEKPLAWEGLLFSSLLINSTSMLEDKKRDYINNIKDYKDLTVIDVKCASDYYSSCISKICLITNNLEIILGPVINSALGECGQEGNADEIIYSAEKLYGVQNSLLDIGLSINSIILTGDDRISSLYYQLFNYLKEFITSPLSDIDEYIKTKIMNLYNITKNYKEGEQLKVDCSFKLKEINSEILQAMQHLIDCIKDSTM